MWHGGSEWLGGAEPIAAVAMAAAMRVARKHLSKPLSLFTAAEVAVGLPARAGLVLRSCAQPSVSLSGGQDARQI